MSGNNPVFGRSMTEEQYSTEWGKSSNAYQRGSYYRWLCERLGRLGKVLEIGCGSGISTLEMLQSAASVTSIEVNPHCISNAKKLLADNVPEGRYSLHEMNVFSDDIFSLLVSNSFDTVVLWLPGAANNVVAEVIGSSPETMTGADLGNYRQKIIKRCGEVAHEFLKDGGQFQISLRSAIEWNAKDHYRAQFGAEMLDLIGKPFTCSRDDVLFRKLERELTASNIGHVASGANIPSNACSVLSSIILRKRSDI